MTLKRNQVSASRKHERGITFLIVALMMFVVLAMAALAIDVSTLYLAHTEAQRAADAAALAAKMRKEGTDIIDLVIEGEREALRRRYFFGAS